MRTPSLRWLLKKSARRTVAIASGLRGVLGSRPRHASIRVLTYHRFGAASRDPFCVSPLDFESQMTMLAELGLAVSLADIEAFLTGNRMLADGSVLVTIDDGCPSLAAQAAPILQRHGVPAVAFVPVGEVRDEPGPRSPENEHPEERVTWRELRTVVDAGVTIGAHGWTHRSLGRAPIADVRRDAIQAREVLEQKLGRPVTSFAYPFGTLADFNDATAEVLREAGYRHVFTSQHGAIRRTTDPFMLPRVKIEGGENRWMFEAAIGGGLDAWRWIDRTFWRMQASGG